MYVYVYVVQYDWCITQFTVFSVEVAHTIALVRRRSSLHTFASVLTRVTHARLYTYHTHNTTTIHVVYAAGIDSDVNKQILLFVQKFTHQSQT